VAPASHALPPDPWSPLSRDPPAAPPRPGSFELPDVLVDAFGHDRFLAPSTERAPDPFLAGRYGPRTWQLTPPLALASLGGNPPLPVPPALAASLMMEGDPAARLLDLASWERSPKKPCKKRQINVVRYGGESDTLALLGCAGEILPDAIDRISVLARPAGIDRPPLPLPDEPDPVTSGHGEWVDHVKLVPPRMLWVLHKIAEGFPTRPLYVISGYRPGGHGGAHGQGRALDLFVMTVSNERLYQFCRKLPDVGCGYYPNNHFVHVDIRPPGAGRAYWIDTSAPGEPSHYVDSWPGVEAGGSTEWKAGE
jgi:hypothetical protein